MSVLAYIPSVSAGFNMAAALSLGVSYVRRDRVVRLEETTWVDGGDVRVFSQLQTARVGRVGFAYLFVGSLLPLLPSSPTRIDASQALLIAVLVALALWLAVMGYVARWRRNTQAPEKLSYEHISDAQKKE